MLWHLLWKQRVTCFIRFSPVLCYKSAIWALYMIAIRIHFQTNVSWSLLLAVESRPFLFLFGGGSVRISVSTRHSPSSSESVTLSIHNWQVSGTVRMLKVYEYVEVCMYLYFNKMCYHTKECFIIKLFRKCMLAVTIIEIYWKASCGSGFGLFSLFHKLTRHFLSTF